MQYIQMFTVSQGLIKIPLLMKLSLALGTWDVLSILWPPMVHWEVSLPCIHHLRPPWRGAACAAVSVFPRSPLKATFLSLCTLCKLPLKCITKVICDSLGFYMLFFFFFCLDIVFFLNSTVVLIHRCIDFLTNFPIQNILTIQFYRREP